MDLIMFFKRKFFKANALQDSKSIMMQCRVAVNRDAVRREAIDGVEHIVVQSATLPYDIVMNGGLYPAEEIEKGFSSLDFTLAPVEHPVDGNGNFISASHPTAIHNFHAGAFNRNARIEENRVLVDKYINVAEARKSERGKRLLDRINELETSESPRPIHTSVGVWLDVEQLDGPKTNADGETYKWVARNMVFDHDAILLDSDGAGTPEQGVGIAVNQQGEECRVDCFELNDADTDSDTKFDRLSVLFGNQEGMSFDEVRNSVLHALEDAAFSVEWIEELFKDRVIFWSKDQLFEVPFVLSDEGIATIVGIPLPVERSVTFNPKTNHQEGHTMKELMLEALSDAGVTVNADISDSDLLDKYNQLQADDSDSEGIAAIVANAVETATAPLADQIKGLEAKINSADEAEIDRFAEVIANSGKYPGIDVDSAKLLGVDKLKEMAANCGSGFGLSPIINNASQDDGFTAPVEAPK